MGGKPSKGTKADQRLAANKPGAVKPGQSKPMQNQPPMKKKG
jgi:hypothetical protein